MNRAPDQPAASAVRAVLRHFRAQRPLRAGSLLVTIFGDAIAPRGGAVTLGSLIRLAAPFGLTERLVRTAVARLAREGWLTATRCGRRSEYRLSAHGARRFAEATRRIYSAGPAGWDRRWTLLIWPAGVPRPARVREELHWLGFGQLAAGVFAHPGATAQEARAWLRNMRGGAGALLLSASAQDAAGEQQLSAAGWDLGALGRRYERFLKHFAPLARAAAALTGERAFLVRTLLIHEYRKIHLQDPLLPVSLLPPDWAGTRAYALSGRIYARLFAASEAYLSVTARRLSEALPPAQRLTYARFGGLPQPAP